MKDPGTKETKQRTRKEQYALDKDRQAKHEGSGRSREWWDGAMGVSRSEQKRREGLAPSEQGTR